MSTSAFINTALNHHILTWGSCNIQIGVKIKEKHIPTCTCSSVGKLIAHFYSTGKGHCRSKLNSFGWSDLSCDETFQKVVPFFGHFFHYYFTEHRDCLSVAVTWQLCRQLEVNWPIHGSIPPVKPWSHNVKWISLYLENRVFFSVQDFEQIFLNQVKSDFYCKHL